MPCTGGGFRTSSAQSRDTARQKHTFSTAKLHQLAPSRWRVEAHFTWDFRISRGGQGRSRAADLPIYSRSYSPSLSVVAYRPDVGTALPKSESPLHPRAAGFRSSSAGQAPCASSMRWHGKCVLGGTPSTASDPLGIGPRCDERLEQCDAQRRYSPKARGARRHCLRT